MAKFLDSVPFSGIIKIRDMMYSVDKPFRLDQGDVSFDAPDTVKSALRQAIADNRTHYVQTTGIPRLLDLLVEKMRTKNGIPIGGSDEVMVTNGGIHAQYIACLALLEPGDEVLVPDPAWPPTVSNILAAQAVPVPYPMHESLGWRPDIAEIAALITPRTKAIVINTPCNPTGGVLTREDIDALAALVVERDLWVFADEAYEDFLFDGREHLSIASWPDLYDRTIALYTLSKTYAITGLRLGYLAIKDPKIRERAKKVVFCSTSNVSSLVQYGAVGALEGSQQVIEDFRRELAARRDIFYEKLPKASHGILSGTRPPGAFYAFVKIDPSWKSPLPDASASLSWAMTEFLIKRARIGSVPGADFGARGEGCLRFCFARDRAEIEGALDSMHDALK
jgi:aspartate/methionine/tyrosine aminotransferase